MLRQFLIARSWRFLLSIFREISRCVPLVEEYYAFTEGIDCKDPLISNRLKDALNYSRNQKEYLCRFLEDGNIPIDDGATERHIRPFAIGRNNFLFCNTVDGAEAMGILYSIVETAKANKVNVYYYLRYILEMMPKHMEDTDREFLDSMMHGQRSIRNMSSSTRSCASQNCDHIGHGKGLAGTRNPSKV